MDRIHDCLEIVALNRYLKKITNSFEIQSGTSQSEVQLSLDVGRLAQNKRSVPGGSGFGFRLSL